MKILTMAVLAGLFIISCRKNSISGMGQISGKWELRESTGGFAGTMRYAPGNGTVLFFDENMGYTSIAPGSPVRSGTYEIKKAAAKNDWLLQLHYVLNNQPQSEKDSIHFESNKLTFLPAASCCDIPATIYERLP